MLHDARQLPSNASLDCDVCVAGAGAAGITIATELATSGLRVVVLESGSLEFAEGTQSLYAGDSLGDPYLDLSRCRLRYFGGTTNHWGGGCSPLDPLDFESRDWVEHSGWPIGRPALDPYYERAHQYCQLGPYVYDVVHWSRTRGQAPLGLDAQRVETAIGQSSPPTRFGILYREALSRAENVDVYLVDVYLNANLVGIALSADASRVSRLQAAVLGGDRFQVTPQVTVLALGGIENARMLLLPTPAQPGGVGNANGLVGRFFMDHPVIEGAIFAPSAPLSDLTLYASAAREGVTTTGFLTLADPVLRREGLLNVRMPLSPITRYWVSEGIESFHQVTGDVGRGEWPDELASHVGNIARDIEMVAEAISRRMLGKRLFDAADDVVGYVLDTMIEPVPDPENRVVLGGERDALGLNRATLNWRISSRDRENLWRCYEILGAELGRIGAGRLRLLRHREDALWGDLRFLSYGSHHMGTTRMHRNPRRGVVDANLGVHGVANLYVAGSSVFPTAGHVPPTLTIVALAVRLADHLREEVTKS